MRTAILLVVVVGLLAIRALAPPPQNIVPLRTGEYSLSASRMWQLSGTDYVEFEVTNSSPGVLVITYLYGADLEVFVDGNWLSLLGQDAGKQAYRPGLKLPVGRYRINADDTYWGHASGYWARPTERYKDTGGEAYLASDRLWARYGLLNEPEFTVPEGSTYVLKHYQGSLESWNGTGWEYFLGASYDGELGSPGIILTAGQYRLRGGRNFAAGYIALP